MSTLDGRGVPQDDVQAYKWFTLAATGFHLSVSDPEDRRIAAEHRALVAAQMTPAQIAEAERLAREWKPTQ